MELIIETTFAFLAAAGFSILFQAPRSCVLSTGFVGTLGWIVFRLLSMLEVPHVLTVFFASITVATACEIMARRHKVPVTVFAISGIVPLVPGSLAYSTMYSLAEGDYFRGLELGTKTFLAAGAIAAGLVFVGSLVRAIKYRGEKHGAKSVIHHQK
ncbi:threonine/serine exporter family protein [Desulfuribacillus alkaliarsenatis]|uniref:Threonine/Serine exporter ThrE domain-containing protein n=1 Tax=Desulfuribacillus alkaliarsenatis TaxID=766136 RepID=A0A1E5FYW6_9FIRM|nr:threonine/serine exporter family protein [Desulfuribacillus alkaliarsenatis]OEF95773.1 hypothetical protein BHF68_11790 [Desulfuribacillus alkaliarsenatis]